MLFFIILTFLHFLNLLFTLLLFAVSTATPKFPPLFSASAHLFPAFPASPSAFPSHFLHSPHFAPNFHILAFTDNLLSLKSLKIYFKKIITLVQKLTLHLVTTVQPLLQIIVYIIYDVISNNLPPKIIYLIVPQVKKNYNL